jgi:hypothetical protein
MHCSFLKFTVALNCALLFWKLLVLLGTSETSLRSMSAPQVNSVLLLEAFQFLMSVERQKYLEQKVGAGIATGYGLDDGEVGVGVPVGARIFTSPRRPYVLWGPPSLLSNGYRGLSPRG